MLAYRILCRFGSGGRILAPSSQGDVHSKRLMGDSLIMIRILDGINLLQIAGSLVTIFVKATIE